MSSVDLQEALEVANEWAEDLYPNNADEQEAFIEGCIEALGLILSAELIAESRSE